MTEDNKQLLLEKNIDNISVANIGTLQDYNTAAKLDTRILLK